MAKQSRIRKVEGWADVGSHGGIFTFESGPVADLYPGLMHIYSSKLTPDLVHVTIKYYVEARGRKQRRRGK